MEEDMLREWIESLQHAVAKKVYGIDRVIFNGPTTIVFWKDGTKTVVKCSDGDAYDPEKGILLCLAKKACRGGWFNDDLRKHAN